eukprot:snap_masked-scaffold_17-processed-gene-5.31-mRNA-1 protein AED:1.00 eAED:1.00 QI:0/0/0/0/1/1/2/0/61
MGILPKSSKNCMLKRKLNPYAMEGTIHHSLNLNSTNLLKGLDLPFMPNQITTYSKRQDISA